jgi:hypothetical protein
MKIDNNLNKIFDLEPIDTQEVHLPTTPNTALQQEDDFELARTTLRGLIGKNDAVITSLVELANNAEHPRAYEVVGQLVKTQSEVAKDLMNLHKQKKEITGEQSPQSIKQQNNIVFAGSTSDLMKMISQQRAKTIDAK